MTTCTYCGIIEHWVDKSYKLHDYPPGFQPRLKPYVPQNTQVHDKETRLA